LPLFVESVFVCTPTKRCEHEYKSGFPMLSPGHRWDCLKIIFLFWLPTVTPLSNQETGSWVMAVSLWKS